MSEQASPGPDPSLPAPQPPEDWLPVFIDFSFGLAGGYWGVMLIARLSTQTPKAIPVGILSSAWVAIMLAIVQIGKPTSLGKRVLAWLGPKARVPLALASLLLLGQSIYEFAPSMIPYYRNKESVESTRSVLRALVLFEKKYKAQIGAYAEDLDELGRVYPEPALFRKLVGSTLDLETFSISIGSTSLVIQAASLDDDKTVIEERLDF